MTLCDHQRNAARDSHMEIKHNYDHSRMPTFINSRHIWGCSHRSVFIICDMIKGNESDIADIDFEILAEKEFKFFCVILFLALTNSITIPLV